MNMSTNHITTENLFPPPKKKSKMQKNLIYDSRDSLGGSNSSIFDANDGHELVDFIRKKKGMCNQPQKIFDDIETNRKSLQIKIKKINENEKTLETDEPSQQAVVPEFVKPQPPVLNSKEDRLTLNSKRSSSRLFRRTLLKEFDKTNQDGSLFLPPTCSTPLCSQQSKKSQEEPLPKHVLPEASSASTAKIHNENIICSPITITDDDSPLQTNEANKQKDKSNPENLMHKLIQENKRLNDLLNNTQINASKENISINSPIKNKQQSPNRISNPRRTFTIERGITGNLILSPIKARAENSQHHMLIKTPTKNIHPTANKLIVTPEQRQLLLRKFGRNSQTSSPSRTTTAQQISRIPVLNKENPIAIPCSINEEKELPGSPTLCQVVENQETVKILEQIQKNSTSNGPVIVIPVNQTFNQAPIDRTITKEQICTHACVDQTQTQGRTHAQDPTDRSQTKEKECTPTPKSNKTSTKVSKKSSISTKSTSQPMATEEPKDKTARHPVSPRIEDIFTECSSSSSDQFEKRQNENKRSKGKLLRKRSSTLDDQCLNLSRGNDNASSSSDNDERIEQNDRCSKKQLLRKRAFTLDDNPSKNRGFDLQLLTENSSSSSDENESPEKKERKNFTKKTVDRPSIGYCLDLRTRHSNGEPRKEMYSRDARKFDKELELLRQSIQGKNLEDEIIPPPPEEFCDKPQSLLSIYSKNSSNDLINESSSDRVSMTQPINKKTSKETKRKPRKKKAAVSEHVKKYLETSKKLKKKSTRKSYNISKRKLYSKGQSDVSDDSSLQISHEKPNKSFGKGLPHRNSDLEKIPTPPSPCPKVSTPPGCPPPPSSPPPSSLPPSSPPSSSPPKSSENEPVISLNVSPSCIPRPNSTCEHPEATYIAPAKTKAISSTTSKENESENNENDIFKKPSIIPRKNKKKQQNSNADEVYVLPRTSKIENTTPNLRRSKREKKAPSAFWCNSKSEYKNMYDIYAMLTSKSRKQHSNASIQYSLVNSTKDIIANTEERIDKQHDSKTNKKNINTNKSEQQTKVESKGRKPSKSKGSKSKMSESTVSSTKVNYTKKGSKKIAINDSDNDSTESKTSKKSETKKTQPLTENPTVSNHFASLTVDSEELTQSDPRTSVELSNLKDTQNSPKKTTTLSPPVEFEEHTQSDLRTSVELSNTKNTQKGTSSKKTSTESKTSKKSKSKKPQPLTENSIDSNQFTSLTVESEERTQSVPRASVELSNTKTTQKGSSSKNTKNNEPDAMESKSSKKSQTKKIRSITESHTVSSKNSSLNMKSREQPAEIQPHTSSNLTKVTESVKGSKTIESNTTSIESKTSKKSKTKKIQASTESTTILSSLAEKSREPSTESQPQSSFREPSTKSQPQSSSREPSTESQPQSSSEDNLLIQYNKKRLTTIIEDPTYCHQSTILINDKNNEKNTCLPPHKVDVTKSSHLSKIGAKRKKAFETDHDETIADISSVQANYMFDLLKNSTLGSIDGEIQSNKSSKGQVSQKVSPAKNYISKKCKIKVKRLRNYKLSPVESSNKVADSGFSSEEMPSTSKPKTDILFNWLMDMLNDGKYKRRRGSSLAKYLQSDGFQLATSDELCFEQIDNVEYAFYPTRPDKIGFGYMRFNPKTKKSATYCKKYLLSFINICGILDVTMNQKHFKFKNGNLIHVYKGTRYCIENHSNDPALLMVIKHKQ